MKKMILAAAALVLSALIQPVFAQTADAAPAVQGIMMKAEDFPRAKPTEAVKKPVRKQLKHKAKRHSKSHVAEVKPCAPVKPIEPPSCNKPK